MWITSQTRVDLPNCVESNLRVHQLYLLHHTTMDFYLRAEVRVQQDSHSHRWRCRSSRRGFPPPRSSQQRRQQWHRGIRAEREVSHDNGDMNVVTCLVRFESNNLPYANGVQRSELDEK